MKDITQLNYFYEEARNGNYEALSEYKLAKQYLHGKQLDAKTIDILKRRGQPILWENIYQMLSTKILGYKSISAQEIQVIGRQESDKEVALVINEIIKSLVDNESYEMQKEKADFDLLLGMSVMQLWVKEDKENDYLDITFRHIPTHSFLLDPYSQTNDASDAKYMHKVVELDRDNALALYGRAIDSIPLNQNANFRQRIELIESWFKEYEKGNFVWNRYIWHPSVILSFQSNPFGLNTHPFSIRKLYIDDKNIWYGIYRNIKPLQDYINLAENRTANMMGSAKIIYEEGAVRDSNEFVRNISKDNSVTKVNAGALSRGMIRFERHNADIAALSQKSNEKRQLAKTLSGLNDEALGLAVNRVSGTAIEQRTNAGLIGIQKYLKASDDMDRTTFRIAINLICKYFTKRQVFAIVEPKGASRYFVINDVSRDDKGNVVVNEKGIPIIRNKISVGKYDIIIKSKPKAYGKEDRFAYWSEMIKTIAGIRPDIIPALLPLMLEDSDSPVADEIREVLSQIDSQPNPQAELSMQTAQLGNEKLKADIEYLKSKAANPK
ncbi:hypothetical protein [Helicobacter sp. 13S00477-4]|uniref:portal protein n=1 Tax=Helicobacter sp. 13S00477-4 TaxID=1905759 RepID=UPI000BA79A96|nr:hypothetical protein [Helicobacter sp. 13S00477-4]PAF51988.1 hypothetical protein BKH44_04830 [Helicobacter sp. 13S00477-4]